MSTPKWSIDKTNIKSSVDAVGNLSVTVPVLDNGVKACDLEFDISVKRVMEIICYNQPAPAGLAPGFTAWQKEA